MISLVGVRKRLSPSATPQAPAISFSLDSLVLEEGGRLGVVGPSGSGKTALMTLLAGIVPPDEGSILVAGERVDTLSPAQANRYRRRHVGIILQGENLLAGLSAFENIKVALRFSKVYPRLQWSARALEMLRRVGLGHCRRKLPHELTASERQKVAVARALVHHPAIVLADEPTARLDPGSARQVLSLLTDLCQEGGQSLVLFTNDDALARSMGPVLDARPFLVRSDAPP